VAGSSAGVGYERLEAFLFPAVDFARASLTLNLTIRSISPNGMG
jgi:hypothetical protein